MVRQIGTFAISAQPTLAGSLEGVSDNAFSGGTLFTSTACGGVLLFSEEKLVTVLGAAQGFQEAAATVA